ncbi:hypothetical protein H6G90_36400 [Nostoc sp. FACHB-145]|nr:hypothetical protein [Nostoc sp. FACHB-145]
MLSQKGSSVPTQNCCVDSAREQGGMKVLSPLPRKLSTTRSLSWQTSRQDGGNSQ